MAEARLDILQVSTSDRGGGAERVAMNLHRAYRERGVASRVAVGRKQTDEPGVVAIDNDSKRGAWFRACSTVAAKLELSESLAPGVWRLRQFAQRAALPQRLLSDRLGHDDFDFPASHDLLDLPGETPALIHCHNLHGSYFDLRALATLSERVPVVLSLHDAWLLSGHCAHSLDCDRWRTGCGACPHLDAPPAVRRDATAANWRRKRDIFRRSRLYVTTPCRWLMEKVELSMLAPAIVEARVIPNGVDLGVFKPGDRSNAREALGIPPHARVLMFAANGVRKSAWKDFATLRGAIEILAERLVDRPLVLLAVGENAPSERLGRAEIRFIPFTDDARRVARHYQAADVYAHAARADTFPTTVLEALACGVPVVASEVGGIPEQVEPGRTGFLVPSGDPQALAERIAWLLSDEALRRRFASQAAHTARALFDFDTQVDATVAWYRRILDLPAAERAERRAA